MDDTTSMLLLGYFIGAVVLFGIVYLGVRMGVKHGTLDADRERARVAAIAKAKQRVDAPGE